MLSIGLGNSKRTQGTDLSSLAMDDQKVSMNYSSSIKGRY